MTGDKHSTILEQYQALRAGNGYAELVDWTSVRVSGRDRQTFLHNFSTNDIKQLRPGDSCEAFFTNVKGKIVGHGIVSCRDDELLILGSPGQGARLVEHLDRYVIREDVALKDETASRSYWLVNSQQIEPSIGRPIAWNPIGDEAYATVEFPRSESSIVGRPLTDVGSVSVGAEAFTAARIEAGFPLFGLDFDETNLPQEIARDRQAISFAKGCYLGQETVARIDALGHVNQQLVGVQFSGASVPNGGLELSLAGNKVGRVTSVAFSPKVAVPVALAMIRREANAVGARLESSAGECEVIALPV